MARPDAHFNVWIAGSNAPIRAQYQGQLRGQLAHWRAGYGDASLTIPVKSSYTRSKIVAQVVAWAEGLGLTVTEADGARR